MLIKKSKFALSPPTHQATRLFCLFLVFPFLARSQNQGTNSFIGAGVNSGNRIPAGITNSGIVAGAMNTNGGGYSFIGGGVSNSIGSGGGGCLYSVIGGGLGNKCPTGFSFVGGGVSNVVEGIGYYSGTIGGGAQNYVWTGFYGAATISGGRLNSATNDYATVGGGYLNRAGGMGDFVGGGQLNSANSILGVVVGGYQNTNKGYCAVLLGGMSNTVSGTNSALIGGIKNQALGNFSVVAGGHDNNAAGICAVLSGGNNNVASGPISSLGGGMLNTANANYATIPGGVRCMATNAGAFVWSGVDLVDTRSTNANSFTVRSPGGARFITATNYNNLLGAVLLPNATSWTVLSDRESKTNFQAFNPRAVLSQLARMPVTSWQYKHDSSRRYIGPTSQDFMEAFHLGNYDQGINTMDADGVVFAAIQGLVDELKERDSMIQDLKAELNSLKAKVDSMSPPAEK